MDFLLLSLADAAEQSLAAPQPRPDKIEHRNRKAAIDIDGLRQIGDVVRIEAAEIDRARERLEKSDDAPQQCGFSSAIRADNSKECALCDLSAEMMYSRMAVVAERQILKLNLRAHAGPSVSNTMTHKTALTAAAIPNLATSVMCNIDQRARCEGCGAGP